MIQMIFKNFTWHYALEIDRMKVLLSSGFLETILLECAE